MGWPPKHLFFFHFLFSCGPVFVFIEVVTIFLPFYVFDSWPQRRKISPPQPGIEPASSASEDKALTTGRPGKSLFDYFKFHAYAL